MRRGAQWALGVGAALIAMAAVGGASADVVFIDLDECSTEAAFPSRSMTQAAAEDDAAASITLSLFGGGDADDPSGLRPDLIFDPETVPPVLVSGLPSPIMSVGARALDDPGVSPYDFFEDVIDVPYSADAGAFTAVPFTPSLTSQIRDFLWASNDFFGPPSGDLASRRGLPLSADADALTAAWPPGGRCERR